MHAFTVDYKARARAKRGHRTRRVLFDRGFFLHGVPRLVLWCRIFGHRPVVDGTTPTSARDRGSRWVCCDRCGVRGEPQGSLDPDIHQIGDRYHGPWAPVLPTERHARFEHLKGLKRAAYFPPGRVPAGGDTGELGGQLILGPTYGGIGFELKVGNAGSEHTLAANLYLWPLGALYLWTSGFGTWVQRRLNPVGYDSRLIGIRLDGGRLRWLLWALRDGPGGMSGKRTERWWMRAELDLRLLDRILGPARYSYTRIPGAEATRLVRLTEGDYLVKLRLERVSAGRRRGRKRTSWSVDWDTLGHGIPTEGPLRGRVTGAGEPVDEHSVRRGTWPDVAVAAIAARIARDRTGRGWSPSGLIPVDTTSGQVIEQRERVDA